jgi:dihydrofolate synthase / folylpolyglutamate synthase
MNFSEALEYMQGLHRFGIKLGNERFVALLGRLGDPHLSGFGIAHVAGTKGKGSTTLMIASILSAHGFRTGGYYSPYVYNVRERVQVDNEMISEADFSRLVTEIRPQIEAVSATDLGATTEFELKTALGFCYFRDRQVEFAAIEVGIGGRLDATNVVHPAATVITNIGLDHTHILGDTHALIAAEKAGIIKPGVDCVTATDNPEALDVIRRTARERDARLAVAAPDGHVASTEVTWTTVNGPFCVRTPQNEYGDLVCGLRGDYQRANAACAISAVESLAVARGFAVEKTAVRKGLASLRMPGRFEILRENPTVILDGAHNAMAAEALASEVRKLDYRRLFLVVGMVQGHEPQGVLEPLAPLSAEIIATEPTWTKRRPAQEIAEAARGLGYRAEIVTPPAKALEAALARARNDDAVLVTGSFYTVGDTRDANVHP